MAKRKREEPPPSEPAVIDKWTKVHGEDYTPDEYCNWVNSMVTKHPVVTQHHGKWKELLEWRDGNQFSEWDDFSGLVKPVELKVRRKKLVINFMKPLVEVIEGKLNFSYSIIGYPNSAENKDIVGAQVATKLLAFNDDKAKTDELMEEMKEDLISCGVGVLKWIWDKSASGVMAPRGKGKRVNAGKQVEEPGEVMPRCVPVFNVRPDPTAKKPSEVRWVIEIVEINRDEMLSLYPNSKDFLDELGEGAATQKNDGRNVRVEEKDPNEKTFLIKEYWERSTEDYPEGRYIVSCGTRILHEGPNPNPKAMLPYFFFFYKKTKYTFWSKGVLHHIQGIQRDFNRTISMESEHVESWKPKMMVGRGALQRANSFTTDSLEVVEVDFSRGEPRPVTMPTLSPEVAGFRDFLLGAKDMVSNVHEVSYSRLPQYASRAPASLYSQMVEQEDNKLAPMVKGINATLIEMARFRLMLMDKHYDRPRLVKIVGENRRATVAWFDKTDLAGNFDVRLEQGVSVNQSTAVQARVMLELFEKGVLDKNDKADRNKIIRTLHFGSAANDFLTDLADSERAMRENQAFIDGVGFEKVAVYLHDDHVLHMQYHTNIAKSEEAEGWPKERFALLDKHIMDHYTFMQALQQAEAALQAGQGGQAAPPGPGQPGAIPGQAPGGAGAPTGQPPGPPPGAEAIQGGGPLPGQ